MATPFDPFREFERLFSTTPRLSAPAAMQMDVFRDGDHFVAAIDLPGVDPSSIDVDIEDRTLTVRAERRPAAAEGVTWLSHERPTGTFARQLTLGSRVALDRIEADYADGVLTLRIPVAEEAKPRKIEVSHSSSRPAIEATSGEPVPA